MGVVLVNKDLPFPASITGPLDDKIRDMASDPEVDGSLATQVDARIDTLAMRAEHEREFETPEEIVARLKAEVEAENPERHGAAEHVGSEAP